MTSTIERRVGDVIRSFNKHVLNPAMLLVAGRRWWYAGVIRHIGRRTGRRYSTPVLIVAVSGDGFVIPLPYGIEVDWLSNVLAAGRATLTVHGETCEVCDPEIMDTAAAADLLSARRRREFARVGIDKFVRLQRSTRGNRTTARR